MGTPCQSPRPAKPKTHVDAADTRPAHRSGPEMRTRPSKAVEAFFSSSVFFCAVDTKKDALHVRLLSRPDRVPLNLWHPRPACLEY